jgi:hypothetical protein
MSCKKKGAKKGLLSFKRKRPGFFSFTITMTLFFCTLLFATHILDSFFKVLDPEKISG